MHSRLKTVVVAGVFLAMSSGSLLAEEVPVSISVTEFAVEVSGVKPGARVALVGADRQLPDPNESPQLVKFVELLSDDDGDGFVTYEREPVASEASVWVAVETSSGRFGAATSYGEAVAPFESPLGLSKALKSGPAVVAAEGHQELLLLLVRPGQGAWSTLAVDGGLAEETGLANGRLTFYQPDWAALEGAESGPGDRSRSDLLVALDPKTFALDARFAGSLALLPSLSPLRGE